MGQGLLGIKLREIHKGHWEAALSTQLLLDMWERWTFVLPGYSESPWTLIYSSKVQPHLADHSPGSCSHLVNRKNELCGHRDAHAHMCVCSLDSKCTPKIQRAQCKDRDDCLWLSELDALHLPTSSFYRRKTGLMKTVSAFTAENRKPQGIQEQGT